MDIWATEQAQSGRSKLGHRTHSVQSIEPCDPITGDQWLPESLIRVKLFPAGDVQVSVCERTLRPPKVCQSRKRSEGKLSDEDALRAGRRARRRIWEACQAKQTNCLVTVTRRGGFDTWDECFQWAEVVMDILEERGWAKGHVVVPEVHTGETEKPLGEGRGFGPTNIGKLHVHIATRVTNFFPFADLHELMKMAEKRVLGHFPETPDERQINVNLSLGRGRHRSKRHTPASCARYLAPYVMKGLEAEARDLNRKRYDVSRDGNKPRVIEIRANPGEHVHAQEACLRILNMLAPHRVRTSLWETEVGGQQVWMQSAVDWGDATAPALPLAFLEADARAIMAAIATKSAAARPSGRPRSTPEGGSWDELVARELAFLGKPPLAKPSRGPTEDGRRPAPRPLETQTVDEPSS